MHNEHPHLKPHLDRAIQYLEKITKEKNIPSVYQKNGSFLTRTIQLFQALFLPRSRKKLDKERVRIQTKLKASREFIKTHYQIIHRYKREGSKKQKEWASHALNIIHDYNATLKTQTKSLKHYVYQQAGLSILDQESLIDLPHEIFMQFQDPTSQKISTHVKPGALPTKPTTTERDIFTMRAITEAKKSDFPDHLPSDLNKMMRKAPISATETQEGQTTVISLMQTLTSFPGEEIHVEGAFKRDASSPVPSVPIPASFRVSTVITQNGFPDPSQNTGFALSNYHLPDCPLRLGHIPSFHKLNKEKQQLALDLLPSGSLNQKAKEILQIKKLAFRKNPAVWIAKHRDLVAAIVEASGLTCQLGPFFRQLRLSAAPFDYLVQTYQMLNKLFVEKPLTLLKHKWQDEGAPSLYADDPKHRFKACDTILQFSLDQVKKDLKTQFLEPHSELEKATLLFLIDFGRIIGTASKKINQLYFSEKIGFTPPLLTQFEIKLLSCALKQLMAFQKELGSKTSIETIYDSMEEELERETRLFELEACEPDQDRSISIALELERYYLAHQ